MKVLLVHPSGLMYTEVYLRLEPLGLEHRDGLPEVAAPHIGLAQIEARTDVNSTVADFAGDACGHQRRIGVAPVQKSRGRGRKAAGRQKRRTHAPLGEMVQFGSA